MRHFVGRAAARGKTGNPAEGDLLYQIKRQCSFFKELSSRPAKQDRNRKRCQTCGLEALHLIKKLAHYRIPMPMKEARAFRLRILTFWVRAVRNRHRREKYLTSSAAVYPLPFRTLKNLKAYEKEVGTS